VLGEEVLRRPGRAFRPLRLHSAAPEHLREELEKTGGDVEKRAELVVVGIDGSDGARAALRFAMDDAARRGAAVRVVRVFQPPEYEAPDGVVVPLPLERVTVDLEKAARQMVDDVVAERGGSLAGVPVEVEALLGRPAKVLVERARGGDLLVLGHRGRGGVASAVLGSVGLHCVLHATGPVAIVRGHDGSP
jgi:nucleotide-binding universal stress UspA family protein